MRPTLRHQILLITLLPVLVVDIFFTVRHYSNEAEKATDQLSNKAEIISRHLASASEFYLFSGNSDQIHRLLQQGTRDPEVTQVAIYDSDGKLVSQSQSSLFDKKEIASYYYKRTAIRLQDDDVPGDVFNPESDDGQGSVSEIGWVHLYLSQSRLQQAISNALMESLIIFALIMLLAAILSELISRKISQPIAVLLEHVKQVEQGKLNERITGVENNELGEVQLGFNQMTQSLQNNQLVMHRRIEQATEQLNEAIVDMEVKNQELSAARDEAQHANRVKSVFLANMSHEIRTPINGIHGFIGLLSEEQLDETQKRYVDIIDKSVTDLTNIINEILDFSKIESGKLRVINEAFDLYDVIEQTRDILYINTLSKNIECYLIIYGDVPRQVMGDKLRLKQILLNLIGNAVKFTMQGHITIRVSVVDESTEETDILISVEDTGIGISEEDQKTLFEAFTQVENEENRRFQGTGLGLVISRNLTSLLGGKLSMYSQLHKGSTFEVLLPLKKSHELSERWAPVVSLSALSISGTKTGLAELTSMLTRNGIDTEPCLLDGDNAASQMNEAISRCLTLADLILIDSRQLDLNIDQSMANEMSEKAMIIILGRDNSYRLPEHLRAFHYLPVNISSRELRQLIFYSEKPGGISEADLEISQQQQHRILLVDDNRVNLTLGEELLKKWGHEPTAESKARQALAVFKEKAFDFVILDIQMPEIDGVTLMQLMRESRPDSTCVFVAMTATVVDEIDNPFIKSGFDYYVAKPIDRQRFKRIVDGKILPGERILGTPEPQETGLSFAYEKSLSLSTDNPRLLKQILQMILRDFPEFRQQLATFQSDPDIEKLGSILHKIHGVTCYCSLPKLKGLVANAETTIYEYSNHELLATAERVTAELELVEREVKDCLERLVA